LPVAGSKACISPELPNTELSTTNEIPCFFKAKRPNRHVNSEPAGIDLTRAQNGHTASLDARRIRSKSMLFETRRAATKHRLQVVRDDVRFVHLQIIDTLAGAVRLQTYIDRFLQA